MALKTVKRVTITLSKSTLKKLEDQIPKNNRSKFIDQLINANLVDDIEFSYEKESQFWDDINNKYKNRTKKSSVEIIRELRESRIF